MRIVVIYNDYFKDRVGTITDELAEEGTNIVYHIPQEDAESFIKENGTFNKIFFTEGVSPEYKKTFSQKPYKAKKVAI